MSEIAMGPQGQRRGRGARERVLASADRLFREQGINTTGMAELCAAANVSKATAYQHFAGKDELIAEYLRGQDPDVMPEVFDRQDLSPREKLLAVFAVPAGHDGDVTPLCPFLDVAVELSDPAHPARALVRDYKDAVADRITATAREAGVADPERLGQQLALLYDGASVRSRAQGVELRPVAAEMAAVLIDAALEPRTAR